MLKKNVFKVYAWQKSLVDILHQKKKVDKTLWSINFRGQEQILNQTGTK